MNALPSPILVLTNHLVTGGAEQYVVAFTRWLVGCGVDVAVAASPGELVPRLHPSVAYHPVDLTDVRLSLPLAVARVRRVVQTRRPRVIVANSMVTAVVARLAAPRTPLVAVGHGWTDRRIAWVGRPLNVADRVVAVSEDLGRRLVAAGLHPERLSVIPNGVDLTTLAGDPGAVVRARADLGAAPTDVVVLHVGRLVPVKAQHRIIEVAHRTRDVPGLRFGIAGAGPLEATLRARIHALGLGDRVRLLGRRDDVPALLLAADVYLQTSDSEGASLAVLEALAAGLPVVTTDVGGMEALVDERNGVRCPVGDDEALARAIRRLAADEALRLGLGRAARERAEREFSFETTCRRMGVLLAEVAAS